MTVQLYRCLVLQLMSTAIRKYVSHTNVRDPAGLSCYDWRVESSRITLSCLSICKYRRICSRDIISVRCLLCPLFNDLLNVMIHRGEIYYTLCLRGNDSITATLSLAGSLVKQLRKRHYHIGRVFLYNMYEAFHINWQSTDAKYVGEFDSSSCLIGLR